MTAMISTAHQSARSEAGVPYVVEPRIEIRRCRAPRDDVFLEAAVPASADRLLTGDEDRLDKGSVEGVAIVTARRMADEVG
jgi:predicted nucleic acid-binding protein